MEFSRRLVLQGTAASGLLAAIGLAGCTTSSTSTASATSSGTLAFNGKAWSYDDTNDVYYQLAVSYVTKPGAADYENLGVYVPGKYLTGTKNSDGTYTATVNASGAVGDYTAATAPIVLPVNTPGYAAQKPPSSYSYDDVSAYLKEGFVYVAAGMRGKDSNTDSYTGNAPWGVTDLKAAVRFVRYNAALLPGSKDRMVVFGHSGGGAQSAVMGSTGDAGEYTAYLESLGAAMTDANGNKLSDAIAGAMCWCPITSLDEANAAYEWNMGQFSTTDTRAAGSWTKAYSQDLAASFGPYLNSLGLKASGKALTLKKSATGVYLAGSYHEHLMSVIETSLNNFLADTTFPYTPNTSTQAGMGSGSGSAPTGAAPSGAAPSGAASSGSSASASASATTYQTVAEYIASLNADTAWVTYDAASNTAKVTSLAGFVASQKSATKSVGAFDGVDRAQTENVVLGLGTAGLHFSAGSKDVLAANEATYATLTNWDAAYASSEYAADFAKTDTLGKDVAYRSAMYNPMNYLSSAYAGYKTSTVAPHWRIRSGLMQGDTASTVEMNLALALENLGVKDVDFATVWGQGHTMAERSGDGATNFIAWVKDTVAKG